jgi:hypothetical protein
MNDLVTIITINYKQNNYTIDCIKSILKSDYPNFKIVLIDNGPTNEDHENLKKRLPYDDRVLLVKSVDNIGYVGGVNLGLEIGSKYNPDYFMIMNNDTIIDEKAITELITTCKSYNNKAIVTGKVYEFDNPQVLQYVGSKLINNNILKYDFIESDSIDKGRFNHICERDMIDDIFWLFNKKLFSDIGYYSNDFWFNGESTDYALRARNNGYKLVYTPYAKIWHKGSLSIGGRDGNPRYAYLRTKASIILRYKHLSLKNFIKYVILLMKSSIISLLKSYYLFIIYNDNNYFKYANSKIRAIYHFFLKIKTYDKEIKRQ